MKPAVSAPTGEYRKSVVGVLERGLSQLVPDSTNIGREGGQLSQLVT